MLCCKCDGPDAGSTTYVEDAFVGGIRYWSTVEAVVLDEPHAVLQVCAMISRVYEEMHVERRYPGGQSPPGYNISCFRILESNATTQML